MTTKSRSMAAVLVGLVAGMSAAGCGDESGGASRDAGSVGKDGAGTGPTFYEDVAPILAANCVRCHQEGAIGPFPLVTYEEVLPLAKRIKNTTAARIMPPWTVDNSGSCNTWKEARWLTDEELATLAAWADSDTREGDPSSAPALPTPPPALSGVTATLDMCAGYTNNASEKCYTASTTTPDDYRCFLVDPGLASDTFLTAFEVIPGSPRTVHHMVLYGIDTAQAEAAAEALDTAGAGPGYTCFGGSGVNDIQTVLGVWAPGEAAAHYPSGTGLPLKAGRKMVLQVHYNTAAGEFGDRTKVNIVTKPSQKAAISVLLSNNSFTLPGGESNVEVTAKITSPVAVDVYGLFPHMHRLGNTFKIEVNALAGGTTCLLDVPRWNFDWQGYFFYEQAPIRLEQGDEVQITCGFNTTSIPVGQTVSFGEGTNDEMCLGFLYVTTP